MTEATLSNDDDQILVAEPLRNFLYWFTICVPQSITGREKDGKTWWLWLVITSENGKIFLLFRILILLGSQAIQFSFIEVDLLLHMGSSRIEHVI